METVTSQTVDHVISGQENRQNHRFERLKKKKKGGGVGERKASCLIDNAEM